MLKTALGLFNFPAALLFHNRQLELHGRNKSWKPPTLKAVYIERYNLEMWSEF